MEHALRVIGDIKKALSDARVLILIVMEHALRVLAWFKRKIAPGAS